MYGIKNKYIWFIQLIETKNKTIMEAKFSARVKDVISFSREEALRLGNSHIGVEHLLLGMLREGEGLGVKILKEFNLDLEDLRTKLEQSLLKNTTKHVNQESIPLVKQAERVLKVTYLEAKLFKSPVIGTEHLLLSILKEDNNLACKILNRYGIIYDNVKDELEAMIEDAQTKMEFPGSSDDAGDTGFSGRSSQGAGGGQRPSDTKSKTPVLDNFGRDLTKLAEADKLDPIVGREKEIERVSQILSRRKKNNPILIGEPGVGKSAIAEGLALRIVQRKVSRVLFNKRVVSLDLASLVAGTKYRGQFEERMKAVMSEIEKIQTLSYLSTRFIRLSAREEQVVHWMHRTCLNQHWPEVNYKQLVLQH